MILETLLKDSDEANVLDNNEIFYTGDIRAKIVFKNEKIDLLKESRKDIKEANDRYRKLSIKQQEQNKQNKQKKKKLKLEMGSKEQAIRVNKLLNSPYLKESEKIKKQFNFEKKHTTIKDIQDMDDKIHESITKPPEKFNESFKKYLQPVEIKYNKNKSNKNKDNIGIAESFDVVEDNNTNNNETQPTSELDKIHPNITTTTTTTTTKVDSKKSIITDIANRKKEILEEWDKLTAIDVIEGLLDMLMKTTREKESEENIFDEKNSFQIKMRPSSASVNTGITAKSRDLTPLLMTDNVRPSTEGRERDRIKRGIIRPTRKRNKIDKQHLGNNWPFV